MNAKPKDRQTWRKIPRLALEEARRRVGLSTPKQDTEPPTRTSWLPSVRLPEEVQRSSTRMIDGAQRAKAPQAAVPQPKPTPKPQPAELFRGGETLPWQPPSEPERGPFMRANVIHETAELAAAVGGAALAETLMEPTIAPAGLVPLKDVPVPLQSGERPLRAVPSVKAALAAIDAAASHRIARIPNIAKSVSDPRFISAAELAKYEALPVVEHVSERAKSSTGFPPPAAAPTPRSLAERAAAQSLSAPPPAARPISPSEHAATQGPSMPPPAAKPMALSERASAQSPSARPAAAKPASLSERSATRSPSAPPTAANPSSLSERISQRHPLRSPSLTAAPDSYPSQRETTPPPLPAATPAPAPERKAPAPPESAPQPFRTNALRAKSEELMAEPLPEVTGSGWSVLLVLTTLLGLGLGLAYVGHVEQTSIATGVLQVRGGPRPVLALTVGPVLALEVAPGDSVTQGQVIARIDATDLNAREQRDVAQLAQAHTEKERIGAAELARLQADQRAFRQKRALLEERARLKHDAIRDRRERMQQVQHAAHAGVATQGDALAVREAERSASEELLLIRQQITETDLQLTEAQKNYQATLERLRHEIDNAVTSLAETRTLLQTTEIRAPVAGRVESLQVTQGQVVSSGTVLARIVPDGAVTSAVVFAPAKDASFLRDGLDANLEFASLPVSEFGKTAARVTRVSKDVASAEEILSALGRGLEEPVIRVELELLQSEQLARVQDKLRSGERLTARLNTRDRRMIALLFEFLRKWYEP